MKIKKIMFKETCNQTSSCVSKGKSNPGPTGAVVQPNPIFLSDVICKVFRI